MHTLGLVPVYPASQGITPERLRSLAWDAYDRDPRRGRAAAGPPARGRAARRAPGGARGGPLPGPAGGPRATRAAGSRSRSCSCSSSRSPAASARAPSGRGRAELPGTGELVGPWLETLPVRADRRPARGVRADRPRPRVGAADAAAADGRGRVAARPSCALHAMLRAVESGRQAAFMAPTETLAEQHMATLDRLLGGHVPIGLLTGSTPARAAGASCSTGSPRASSGMIVGTHALIEPTVEFRALGLVVVDEQHRFGVRQRAALDAKGPGGPRPARAPHDRHADPAHARADGLRRPRRHDPARAAGRPPAGRDPRGGRRARARPRATSASARRSRRGASASWSARSSRSRRRSRRRPRRSRPSGSQATEFRDQRVELIHGQMPSKRKQEAMARVRGGRGGRARGHQRDRGRASTCRTPR